MSTTGDADRRLAASRGASAQTYARLIGILFLISLVAGGFGEAYVPSKLIVAGDAAATARNIVAGEWMFRLGFAGYLVEACCDVALTALLYLLLRLVRRDVALTAAFFRLMGTATFAFAELLYFAALPTAKGSGFLQAFSTEQLNALAMLWLKLYGLGAGLFSAFYGIGAMLLGYLVYRSGFLPKFVGVLLALAGAGFVVGNFVTVLAPKYASGWLMAPMGLAAALLAVWLLVKGVDVTRWKVLESGTEA